MNPENRFDQVVRQSYDANQRRLESEHMRAVQEKQLQIELVDLSKSALTTFETQARTGTSPVEVFSADDASLCSEFIQHMSAKRFTGAKTLEDRMPIRRVARPGLLGALGLATNEWGRTIWRGHGYPVGCAEDMRYNDYDPERNLFLCLDGLLRVRIPITMKSNIIDKVYSFENLKAHSPVPQGQKVHTGSFVQKTYYTESFGDRSSGYKSDWGTIRNEHTKYVFQDEPLKSILNEIALNSGPAR